MQHPVIVYLSIIGDVLCASVIVYYARGSSSHALLQYSN